MRPLKLIITGFCSYGNRTEIDLEKLGTSGLYLITGKTGSGKTTIFDAITYALYGEPSGNNRETSMLRSNFAGPDLPTEVELTFELRDKLYHIKRNPSYERRAKKGDGFTTETANVLLTMPDGKILEGPKNVDKKIIELMGIDRDQFSQIVMLAQGDFQKLLTENTTARQTIFRKIFKTDNYEKLQKRLAEKHKELCSQVSAISRDLNLYFQNTQCDCDSVLSLELNKAKETEMPWNEKIELLERIIAEDKEKQSVLEKEEQENQKKLDDLLLQVKKAEEIEKDREALELKKEDIKTSELKVEAAKISVKEAEEKLKENPEKEKKATLIGNDLGKYEEVEKLAEQLSDLATEIKNTSDSISLYEKKVADKSVQLESAKVELKELENAADKAAELALTKNGLDNTLGKMTALEGELKNYNKLSLDLEKAQGEYKEEALKAQTLQQEYLNKNKLFLDGQAGILAENLKPEEPCPVCGSVHHPVPAKKQENVPGEEELNNCKTKADSQNQIAEEKSRMAFGIKSKLELVTATVEKGRTELFSDVEMSGLEDALKKGITGLKDEIEKIDSEITKEEKRKERKEALSESIPVMQSDLDKMNKQQGEEVTKLSVQETSQSHLKEQFNAAKSKLQFETKQMAEAEVKRLEMEVAANKSAFDTAQETVHKEELKLKQLQGEASSIEERLKDIKSVNKDKLKEQQVELETVGKRLSEALKTVFARIQTNETAVENIKPDSKELVEKQNRQQLLMELTNTANGNLGQKKAKIMLETYVQMHYFDRIIAHANKRFMIMSGGQYELVRKKEADNAQSQTGLELNVIDHYKGKERDVKSLSGGESFEASLSLALGLSDEIAESAGGIRIDSMFVDEGFGTLDSDTLQKAYNALVSVTEGNRLVGIISHVDYLKEKIDRQLVITKEPECGSVVTINL